MISSKGWNERIATVLVFGLSLALGACSSAPRRAVDPRPFDLRDPYTSREAQVAPADARPVSVYGAGGFTSGPSTFLLAGGADVHLSPLWSVGPQVHLGISDKRTLLAPSVNAKRYFPLVAGASRPLLPYAQAGAGLAYLNEDRKGGDRDDLGLLFNVGGGLRCEVSDGLSIGSGLQLNILLIEVLDERIFLSWEVVQLVFSF